MIARLQVRDLALVRGGRRLFEGLSFQVEAGQAVAVVGANGAGKTSLLRAIAGLLMPAAGTIGFGEVAPEEAQARGLHWLGHADGLKGGRTAGEELAFWATWAGGEAKARAAEALDLQRLLPLEVRRLSAGQRRRLALARLIAAPRPLWLLDEPMAPLDAATRTSFGALMAAHLAGGGLVVAAVHDPLPVPAQEVRIG